MKNFCLFLILGLFFSCSSVDTILKNPNCVVWKDQKIWGPASVEIVGKKVTWIGGCRGMHWDCKKLEITSDENKNIMAEEIPVGFIENNRLSFFEGHPFENYISSKDFMLNASAANEILSASITYHYTDKCSVDEAIIGALAIDIITHIQKEKSH